MFDISGLKNFFRVKKRVVLKLVISTNDESLR